MSKKSLIMLWSLGCLILSTPIQAGDYTFKSGAEKVNLIELYTSQGCSSCPPAERWLGDFKNDPRLWKEIVPVAFHVTYWDYLGWRDSFGADKFNQRQSAYQREGLIRSVYTPGLVVDGSEWRGWFRGNKLPTHKGATGDLTLRLNGNNLVANYTSKTEQRTLQLNVALLGVDLKTAVADGENQGKNLPQDFVVLHFQKLDAEHGQWQTKLPTPKIDQGRLAIAAWITSNSSQSPQQATGGWIKF